MTPLGSVAGCVMGGRGRAGGGELADGHVNPWQRAVGVLLMLFQRGQAFLQELPAQASSGRRHTEHSARGDAFRLCLPAMASTYTLSGFSGNSALRIARIWFRSAGHSRLAARQTSS